MPASYFSRTRPTRSPPPYAEEDAREEVNVDDHYMPEEPEPEEGGDDGVPSPSRIVDGAQAAAGYPGLVPTSSYAPGYRPAFLPPEENEPAPATATVFTTQVPSEANPAEPPSRSSGNTRYTFTTSTPTQARQAIGTVDQRIQARAKASYSAYSASERRVQEIAVLRRVAAAEERDRVRRIARENRERKWGQIAVWAYQIHILNVLKESLEEHLENLRSRGIIPETTPRSDLPEVGLSLRELGVTGVKLFFRFVIAVLRAVLRRSHHRFHWARFLHFILNRTAWTGRFGINAAAVGFVLQNLQIQHLQYLFTLISAFLGGEQPDDDSPDKHDNGTNHFPDNDA